MEEKKREFLTPEQRRGLLYGSLISAVLSGGAALRSGGNVTDALGRGALGAAQAFGGGLEEVANLRHREIEEDKMLEAMRASQESTALAKKSAASREAHEAAQTEKIKRETAEESARAGKHEKLIQQTLQEQALAEEGRSPGTLPISPTILRALQFSTPQNAATILTGGERAQQIFNLGERKIEATKALPGIKAEAEAPIKREEFKAKEKIAQIGAGTREKVAQVGAESRERVAETGTATAAAKVKPQAYLNNDPESDEYGKVVDYFKKGFIAYPSKAAERAMRLMALGQGYAPESAKEKEKPRGKFTIIR